MSPRGSSWGWSEGISPLNKTPKPQCNGAIRGCHGLYKKHLKFNQCQKLFKKNCKKLVDWILDDRPHDAPSAGPNVRDIEASYKEIFETCPIDDLDLGTPKQDTGADDLFRPLTSEEVSWVINNTRTKSMGPDGVSINVQRRLRVHDLTLALNGLFMTGNLPE